MRALKKLLLFTIVLVGVIGGLGYLAVVNIDAVVARYREPIERWVSEQLGGRVDASAIGVKLLPRPRLDLKGVELRFGGDEPALSAVRIGVDFELMPLLWRSVRLNAVIIDEPVVRLERVGDGLRLRGTATLPAGMSSGPGLFVGLDRFEVRGGTVSLSDVGSGKSEDIEGIDLSGGLRFEDGELRIAPLSVRAAKVARLGDFSGEFGELRSSMKNGRGSMLLREGGFGGVRFSGEGEWRLAEGAARFRVNGAKTDLGDMLRGVDAVLGRSITTGLGEAKYSAKVEPKFSIEFRRGGSYRVNGTVGFEEGTVGYRDLVVGEIRGVTQVALSDQDGKIALESFRGTIGATRASVSLEGIIDLVPFGGELRVTAAALPLADVKRLLPDGAGYGVEVASGTLGGKVTYRLGQVPQWNFVAELREGAGTVRGVPFQDGVGKLRIAGDGGTLDATLDQLTLGFAGGAEAVVLKGELRGDRGSGSIASAKLTLPTVLALLGTEIPGWSELTGEMRLDLKGRYEGGVLSAYGPIVLTGGAGRRESYAVSGVTGELELQMGTERKLVAREVHFDLNGEPLVWRGSVRGAGDVISFERTVLSGFGGDLAIDGTMSLAEPGRIECTARGRGLSIEPVRRVFGTEGDGGALTGELTDVRWRLAGTMGENFARSLEGGIAFRLERGALRGVNIGRVVVERIGSVPLLENLLVGAIPAEYRPYFEAPDTPIHSLSGEIDLAGGRASTQALRLESDLFGLDARGDYELGREVDLGATLWLERRFAFSLAERVRELRSLFGSEGTIVMPLRITGAPADLAVSPDIRGLIARAARGVVEREAERFIDRAIEQLSGGGTLGGESVDTN